MIVSAVAIHLTIVKIVESKYHHRISSCQVRGKCNALEYPTRRYLQELYSLGFAGIFSSMFPVFPVTSIFARTLIGDAVSRCQNSYSNL